MKEGALLYLGWIGVDGGERLVWKAEVCKSHELGFYRL